MALPIESAVAYLYSDVVGTQLYSAFHVGSMNSAHAADTGRTFVAIQVQSLCVDTIALDNGCKCITKLGKRNPC